MFAYLKGYSPIHNVKAGTRYPATFVTTGDHDDRVFRRIHSSLLLSCRTNRRVTLLF